MILNGWKQAISQRCIFRTDDGRIFAFPFGPFVAYLLPDAKTQSLLVNAILWPQIAWLPIWVAIIPVLKIYSLPVDILLLSITMMLQWLVVIPLVCFITRKCVRLPIALSIHACASLHDPGILAILFEDSWRLFFAILFTMFLPNPFCYLLSIWLLFLVLANWYMVILRYQDRTVSDSFRDKSV